MTARLVARLALVACLLAAVPVMAACDSSAPQATPTVEASPSAVVSELPPGGSSTPALETSATPTESISQILTEVPGFPTATAGAPSADINQSDQVRVYALVVDQLLGERLPPYVYLSPYIGQGERLDDPNEQEPIPDGLLPALSSEITGPRFESTDFSSTIGPLEDGGTVKNNGAFVTLGPIVEGSSSSAVSVLASLYHKVGDAVGMRFQFQKDATAPGGWKLLSSTQQWTDQ